MLGRSTRTHHNESPANGTPNRHSFRDHGPTSLGGRPVCKAVCGRKRMGSHHGFQLPELFGGHSGAHTTLHTRPVIRLQRRRCRGYDLSRACQEVLFHSWGQAVRREEEEFRRIQYYYCQQVRRVPTFAKFKLGNILFPLLIFCP